jgi:hypothetical protein
LKAAKSGAVQTQDGAIHVNGPALDGLLDGKDENEVNNIITQATVLKVWQSPASRRANDETSSTHTTEL